MAPLKESPLKKVDAQKRGLQEGFVDTSPPVKQKTVIVLSDAEEIERQGMINVLKLHLTPSKLSTRSLPDQDKQSLFRKLDRAELATLKRFFVDTPKELVADIARNVDVDVSPSVIADWNMKYKDISP